MTLPLATSTRKTGVSSVSSAVTSRLRPSFAHSIEPTERSQPCVSGADLARREVAKHQHLPVGFVGRPRHGDIGERPAVRRNASAAYRCASFASVRLTGGALPSVGACEDVEVGRKFGSIRPASRSAK